MENDSVLLVNDHLILSLDDRGFEELQKYFWYIISYKV